MRYLLFAYNETNKEGGINDLEGAYETLYDAEGRFSITSVLAKDHAYIYDTETGDTYSYNFKDMKVVKDWERHELETMDRKQIYIDVLIHKGIYKEEKTGRQLYEMDEKELWRLIKGEKK